MGPHKLSVFKVPQKTFGTELFWIIYLSATFSLQGYIFVFEIETFPLGSESLETLPQILAEQWRKNIEKLQKLGIV